MDTYPSYIQSKPVSLSSYQFDTFAQLSMLNLGKKENLLHSIVVNY